MPADDRRHASTTTGPAAGTAGARCDHGHADPIELLGRAVDYTRGSLQAVADTDLSRPTPCTGWDLRQLLGHMDDSLQTMVEIAEEAVVLPPVRSAPDLGRADGADELLDRLRRRACSLLSAWSARVPARVGIAGGSLAGGLLAAVGAVEITAHGWDVAVSLGRRRPVPQPLAAGLLPAVDIVVTDDDRPHRFAAPVPLPAAAAAPDRLVAALGRRP